MLVECGIRLRYAGYLLGSVYALRVKFGVRLRYGCQFGVCLRYAGEIMGPSTLCRWNLGSIYAMRVKLGV